MLRSLLVLALLAGLGTAQLGGLGGAGQFGSLWGGAQTSGGIGGNLQSLQRVQAYLRRLLAAGSSVGALEGEAQGSGAAQLKGLGPPLASAKGQEIAKHKDSGYFMDAHKFGKRPQDDWLAHTISRKQVNGWASPCRKAQQRAAAAAAIEPRSPGSPKSDFPILIHRSPPQPQQQQQPHHPHFPVDTRPSIPQRLGHPANSNRPPLIGPQQSGHGRGFLGTRTAASLGSKMSRLQPPISKHETSPPQRPIKAPTEFNLPTRFTAEANCAPGHVRRAVNKLSRARLRHCARLEAALESAEAGATHLFNRFCCRSELDSKGSAFSEARWSPFGQAALVTPASATLL